MIFFLILKLAWGVLPKAKPPLCTNILEVKNVHHP